MAEDGRIDHTLERLGFKVQSLKVAGSMLLHCLPTGGQNLKLLFLPAEKHEIGSRYFSTPSCRSMVTS